MSFLQSCEGYRGTAYTDSRGNCTIGYGHFLHIGACTSQDSGLLVDRDAAQKLFVQDTQATADQLEKALPVKVTQQQFDALFSLSYNMGVSRLETHDVWKDLKTGNFVAIPDDIKTLAAGGKGMPQRRAKEANMFSNGVYPNACY